MNNILKNDLSLVDSTQKVKLTETIIELVRANLGITIMAKWAINPSILNDSLKVIPLKNNMGKRDWYIASLHKATEKELSFINHIKDDFIVD